MKEEKMDGFVELQNARQVKETEKAVLLDLEGKPSWFPKKAIRSQNGKYFVAIWFNKKNSGATPTPTKTELVNKFEKKRLIQLNLPLGNNLDCLIQAGEHTIKCYAEYRKGSVNSGIVLSEAFNELSHWLEENKKEKVVKN
jgi:hypothetical protein